jgi:ABC-type branched-subunit amino acid transport system ATPase component
MLLKKSDRAHGKQIRRYFSVRRLSVLLAEQSLDFMLSLSDRLYILEKGEVKFTGTPADVRAN